MSYNYFFRKLFNPKLKDHHPTCVFVCVENDHHNKYVIEWFGG